jgi:hypothetical protein
LTIGESCSIQPEFKTDKFPEGASDNGNARQTRRKDRGTDPAHIGIQLRAYDKLLCALRLAREIKMGANPGCAKQVFLRNQRPAIW